MVRGACLDFEVRRPEAARDRLIVALDTPRLDEATGLARRLAGAVGMLKVGLELFVSEGPRSVLELRAAGMPVFLDLKLHDIPNTVRSAAREAGSLGASLLTVHASGGADMIRAAVMGAREGAEAHEQRAPCILAVTVLTSIDEDTLSSVGIEGPTSEAVARLAELAVSAGAGGLVCSPAEASLVRSTVGAGPLIVTPGVRPEGERADDQARVATPAAALAAGADYLVVGRPIRAARDPRAAADSIVSPL